MLQDKIKGCIFGGAMGDALGYPVEFNNYNEIIDSFGVHGITGYSYDSLTHKALISDDTQMSLFTIDAILTHATSKYLANTSHNLNHYLKEAYTDWLYTQYPYYPEYEAISWIFDIDEMHFAREPGRTCLSVISFGNWGDIDNHVNNSKGCGGVMREAPIGLFYKDDDYQKIIKKGASSAALTHGHPLGYITAGMLARLIQLEVYHKNNSACLEDLVKQALKETAIVFKDDCYMNDLLKIINKALLLSKNSDTDIDNINKIGEGWVGEETLAIAIYCCLRHQDDFSKALIASVNHNGDSDSTGAVAGNIIGTWLGFNAIEDKWKENLELYDIIDELADDLYLGLNINQDLIDGDKWTAKYKR